MQSTGGLEGDSPVQRKNPRTRFTEKILKSIVGNERANAALQSLSMGLIPGAANSAFNLGSKILVLVMMPQTCSASRATHRWTCSSSRS
jgi:hypothetical protein